MSSKFDPSPGGAVSSSSPATLGSKLGFSVLSKDTLTCGQLAPGFEPPTFWLLPTEPVGYKEGKGAVLREAVSFYGFYPIG